MIKKRYHLFSTFFLCLFAVLSFVSCKLNDEVKLSKENIRLATVRLKHAMNDFVWHCDKNPINQTEHKANLNSLIFISNMDIPELSYISYDSNNKSDVSLYKFTFEVVPYDNPIFVKIDCTPTSGNNGNIYFEIEITNAENGEIKVRINGNSIHTYTLMNKDEVPSFPNIPNVNPDIGQDKPKPDEGGESIPSIPESSDISTFKSLMADNTWKLLDSKDCEYTRDFYPNDIKNPKPYFIYGYNTTRRYQDEFGNQLKNPRVILFFNEQYSVNSSSHMVMNGTLAHGILRAGTSGNYEYYAFETLNDFIHEITIEVNYVLPTGKGYSVWVTDDGIRNRKEEYWQAIEKTR